MIEFARFVGQVFLPSVVSGVALGVAWRYLPGARFRTALQWTASLLFFGPQPFALFLGAYSSRLRLYQQVLLSLWGFGTCGLTVSRIRSRDGAVPSGLLRRVTSWRQTPEETQKTETMLAAFRNRPPQLRSRVVLAGAALAMATLGVWCGWNVVGDYLLTHQIVVGMVEGARVVRGTRSPDTYQVLIDHRPYNITRDLLGRMRPGEVVEVEVGVASGTIVAIRGDAHPGWPRILRQ